jgi:nucleotide-binding universal stress UspA family protein
MIKDIVVHLTGSSEDMVRLAYANRLAEILGAHLVGLHVHVLPSVLTITDASGSTFLAELIETSNKEADEVAARLKTQLAALGAHTELRRLDVYPDEAGEVLAAEARVADLFVGTRPYGDPAKSEYVEEAVLFGSGRACIFLPPKFSGAAKFDTVLVGWKNTRESARAVAEALPLMQLAKTVEVVTVSKGNDGPDVVEDAADIGRYLARHGIKAEIRIVPRRPTTAETLLHEAEASRADLLVIGGYGHSRLQEIVLGGVTRDVLKAASIPVLIAH